jgi:hypothetical protein
MKKYVLFNLSLIIMLMFIVNQIEALGQSDTPGLYCYDFSSETAQVSQGFICSLESSVSVDPSLIVELNAGYGFHKDGWLGGEFNLAGGLCYWEDDVSYDSELFFYAVLGEKAVIMLDWFSIAFDFNIRMVDTTDEFESPMLLLPSLLLGFGKEEFLTIGLLGLGISVTFHWSILHLGFYYQPEPIFSNFDDFGLKIALGIY